MTTAFILWGGGSLGAAQVGMLRALTAHGIRADMVVGASIGALNGAYYASRPDAEGVEELARLWLSVSGHDVYPVSGPDVLRTLVGNLPFHPLRGALQALGVLNYTFPLNPATLTAPFRAPINLRCKGAVGKPSVQPARLAHEFARPTPTGQFGDDREIAPGVRPFADVGGEPQQPGVRGGGPLAGARQAAGQQAPHDLPHLPVRPALGRRPERFHDRAEAVGPALQQDGELPAQFLAGQAAGGGQAQQSPYGSAVRAREQVVRHDQRDALPGGAVRPDQQFEVGGRGLAQRPE